MDNQHAKIKGYRDLSQEEIDLMNEIKEQGEILEALTHRVGSHLRKQMHDARNEQAVVTLTQPPPHDPVDELVRLEAAAPQLWLQRAGMDLQTGLMALTRSVAQPTTF